MAYKQSYLKSQPIESSSLGILNTNQLNDADNKPLSSFKPGHSQEDSTDDLELFALMQQFYTVRTDLDSLTLDDYLPTAEIKDIGWVPPESIADLSDLIHDLENIELGKGLLANSRLSMVIMDGKDKGRGGRRPDSIALSPEVETKLILANDKLKNVNLKKLTTKIYFNTEDDFETVTLTSLSNPKLIIQGFIDNGRLEKGVEYVLMEMHSNFLVERSIKCWEPVLPIISNWAPESHSALLIRRKQFEIPMNSVSIQPPIFSGMIHYQAKKNKWEKRFIIVKKGNVYLAKNEGLTNIILLCSLIHFDIFALTHPKKKAPTPHVVSLKSQQPVHMFEKPEENFIYFLAFDKPNVKDMFTRSLAYSRSWQMYQNYLAKPDPLSPFTDPTMLSDQIAGLEFDQGQFPEVENSGKSGGGSNGLTKNTVGGIAERLFRLVLTGDQGKTDIDKVIGAKALPDVFAQGSLLSKNEPAKPVSPPTDKEETEHDAEVKDTFKSGSLLSKGITFKKASASKGNTVEPPAGSLLAKASTMLGRRQSESAANNSNNTTLLGNIATSLNRNLKPNPVATVSSGNNGITGQPVRNGPLLQVKAKDEDLFNNKSLLSQPASHITRKLSIPSNAPAPINFTNSNDNDLPLSYRMRSNTNLKNSSTNSSQSYSPTSSNSPSPRAPNSSNFTPTSYESMRPLPSKPLEGPPPLNRKTSKLNFIPNAGPLTNIKELKSNEQRYKKGSLLDNFTSNNPNNDLGKAKSNGILPVGRPTLLTQCKSSRYASASANGKAQGPLISLDDSRFKRHTDQIREKNFRPLLSFK